MKLFKSPMIWFVLFFICFYGYVSGMPQEIEAKPIRVNPGAEITVNYSGAPGYDLDWIGIYPASAPSDRSWLSWQYTRKMKSGTMIFKAPDKPGEYNFRLFENDGYKLLGTSNTVVVENPTVTGDNLKIEATPTNVQPGGEITVNYSGAPGYDLDWIGIYPASAPSDRSWLSWQYTRKMKSGTMIFKAPDKPGKYNFRLFENDGYKLLGTSNTVEVGDK